MSKKRSKIVRKRRKSSFSLAPYVKRGVISLIVFAFLLWGGFSLWATGTITQVKESVVAQWIDSTAGMGFVVSNIYVEGRHFSDRQKLTDVVSVSKGDPLFEISPDGLGEKISALNWVKSVKVSRQLPDSLRIDIEERLPMALLRNDDKSLSLLDWDGRVITDKPDARFTKLIIVTGEGAGEELPKFLPLLLAEPTLAKHIETVQYIGERRWNLYTDNDIRIQLPEDETPFALARVAREQENDDLLAQALKDIDARYPDRLVVQAVDGADPKLIKTGQTQK